MSKYAPLADYLAKQKDHVVQLSFRDVEKKLGFRLPKSAYTHRAWWSNNPDNSVMTRVWINAGFRTQEVDMDAQKVVFRNTKEPLREMLARESGRTFVKRHASKTEGHPLRGALKGILRLVGGTDLTKPVDPEWGNK